MKKIVAIGLLCMVSAQIFCAGRSDDGSYGQSQASEGMPPERTALETPESEQIKALSDRNFFSLAAEAAAKSTAKGIKNVAINTYAGVDGAFHAAGSPLITLFHAKTLGIKGSLDLGARYVKNGAKEVVGSTLNTALKPLKQVYNSGKSIYLTNSDRAATREVEKFYNTSNNTMPMKILRSVTKNNVKSKSLSLPNKDKEDQDFFNKELNRKITGKSDFDDTVSDQNETIIQYHLEQLKAEQIKAARAAHAQASLGVKLFQRNKVKLAMKKAINNATKDYLNSVKQVVKPVEQAKPVTKKAEKVATPAVDAQAAHSELENLQSQLKKATDKFLSIPIGDEHAEVYILRNRMIYLKKQIAAEKKAQSASAPAQKPMPVSQPATTVAQDASNPVAESQASPVDVLNKLSPTEGIPSDPGVGATIRQLANSSQVDKANTDNIQ